MTNKTFVFVENDCHCSKSKYGIFWNQSQGIRNISRQFVFVALRYSGKEKYRQGAFAIISLVFSQIQILLLIVWKRFKNLEEGAMVQKLVNAKSKQAIRSIQFVFNYF